MIDETGFLTAAELTKGMLEEHEIPCFIMNQQDSAYPQIGDIQILVAPEHVVRAKYLIQKSREDHE